MSGHPAIYAQMCAIILTSEDLSGVSFLGTPAMSRIPGRNDQVRFTSGDLSVNMPIHPQSSPGEGELWVRLEFAEIFESGGIKSKTVVVENLGGAAVFSLDEAGHWIRVLYHRSETDARPLDDIIDDGFVHFDLAVASAKFFMV